MLRNNASYTSSLKQAQAAGFAESDPALDVKGHDASSKLSILLAHAFGVIIDKDELIFSGIDHINENDITFCRENNYSIKLVAHAQRLKNGKVISFLLPQFIPSSDALYHVHDEYNALITESTFDDHRFFLGKGAGAFPTASAVISDLFALTKNYRYDYSKISSGKSSISTDYFLKVHISYT